MKILAVDQARNGAWCVYDYEKKTPVEYGVFSFPAEDYTFAKAMVCIKTLIKNIIDTRNISAVFIEDIQLRKNVDSFKKLAQLQGCLVSMFEENEYLYDFIPPAKWQNFCNARGRTTKEIKNKVTEVSGEKKQSKVLSIQAANRLYNINTEDDNLADSIMIGHFVVHNIKIEAVNEEKELHNGKQ